MSDIIEIIEQEEYIVDIEVEDSTGGQLPVYTGATTVTPKAESQTLATKNKSVLANIVVQAIPFRREANSAGGNTVYIASN